MKIIKTTATLIVAGLLAFPAFSAKQIDFKTPDGIYPEGIAYYPQKDAFLVSSITKGQIGLVDGKGNYSVFLDSEDFYSTVGLKIKNNKLYVAVGDLGLSNRSGKNTPKSIARLVVFDLDTKKELAKIDLHKKFKGAHWANDLFVNDAGTVFVTDSFSPVIYKVTPEGRASVFVTDERFKGEGINLNGIQGHPNGYLLVAKNSDGRLFKVDVSSKKVTEVKLPSPIVGMDGLLLLPNGNLLVGQNTGAEAYHELKSDDDFKSASMVKSEKKGLNFATTATLAKGKAFFLNSYISDLFGGKNDRTSFFIRQFDL